jgi:hypothetical protein
LYSRAPSYTHFSILLIGFALSNALSNNDSANTFSPNVNLDLQSHHQKLAPKFPLCSGDPLVDVEPAGSMHGDRSDNMLLDLMSVQKDDFVWPWRRAFTEHIRANHTIRGRTCSNAPPIPIFIICFNRITVLKETLRSIHDSIRTPFEIIISDHGSTYPPLVEYLKRMEQANVTVVWNNKGSLAIW